MMPITALLHVAKQVALVGAAGATVVVGAGMAWSYWGTAGTGTGQAAGGTDAGVTVVHNSTNTGLVPGGTAQAIDFSIDNTSLTTEVQLRTVVITFGTFPAGCSAADFTLVQPSKPSVGVPVILAADGLLSFTSGGTGTTGATGASIAMINSASNQNGCKSATIPLIYTVT